MRGRGHVTAARSGRRRRAAGHLRWADASGRSNPVCHGVRRVRVGPRPGARVEVPCIARPGAGAVVAAGCAPDERRHPPVRPRSGRGRRSRRGARRLREADGAGSAAGRRRADRPGAGSEPVRSTCGRPHRPGRLRAARATPRLVCDRAAVGAGGSASHGRGQPAGPARAGGDPQLGTEGPAARVAHPVARPGPQAGDLVPPGRRPVRRRLAVPRGDQPGRDDVRQDPRTERRGSPGPDAVHAPDVGRVRRAAATSTTHTTRSSPPPDSSPTTGSPAATRTARCTATTRRSTT